MEKFTQKFGARFQSMLEKVKETGKAEGIAFNFGGKVANTLESHRLIEYAYAMGGSAMQNKLVELLFSLYFERQANLGDHEVLAEAAAAVGMDKAEARSFLASSAGRDEVLRDIRSYSLKYRITGVPFFIFQERYVLGGALEQDAMEEVLRELVSM